MAIGCKFGRHIAPHPYFAARGEGMWFGECPGCLQDIVKEDGRAWRTVPAGYRVLWPRRGSGSTVPRLVPREPGRGAPALPPSGGIVAALFRALARPFRGRPQI